MDIFATALIKKNRQKPDLLVLPYHQHFDSNSYLFCLFIIWLKSIFPVQC